MEGDSHLLDILDLYLGKTSHSSFLINKQCVRNSLFTTFDFLPKEDFIIEFLDNNKSRVNQTMMNELYEEARQAAQEYLKVEPQAALNQGANLWIVKPSSLSRGRGITISDSLIDIFHYIASSDCDFIVQKFIENAELIDGRRVALVLLVRHPPARGHH